MPLLATLCATFTFTRVSEPHHLWEEIEKMEKGSSLSSTSCIDVLFDQSLNAATFINCLKSSSVPQLTVRTLLHVRDSPQYTLLQPLYFHLLTTKEWNTFRNSSRDTLNSPELLL